MSSLRGPGAEGVPAPASPTRYPRCIALPAPSVARRSLMRVHKYQQRIGRGHSRNALVVTTSAKIVVDDAKQAWRQGLSHLGASLATVMRPFAASKPTTFWYFVGSGGLLHLAPCQNVRNVSPAQQVPPDLSHRPVRPACPVRG